MCELLRWSASFRGVFEESYPNLAVRSNAMHQICFGVTWGSKDRLANELGTLSHWLKYEFAQEKKIMQCWSPMVDKVKVWQSWSNSRLKWLFCVLYLILSIGMPYYQEGCNIDCFTQSKVLIDNPWEDPKRKPLRADIEILEWSSLDLIDQVGSYKQGFGVLWPWLVWPVWGTGLTGPGSNS